MLIRSTRRCGAKHGGFSATRAGDEWSFRPVPLATTPDGGHPISYRGISMQRLARRLAQYWGRFWGLFTPAVAKQERDDEGHWTKSRSRFWRELREGQREADAHASRSRP